MTHQGPLGDVVDSLASGGSHAPGSSHGNAPSHSARQHGSPSAGLGGEATSPLISPHGARGSYGELLRVALPLIISYGATSLQYVIDRLFLFWYTPDALAAALPASLLHWTFISLALGTVLYVNTFVAQYCGAGRYDRVGAVLWQGVYLSVGASLLALALVPLAPHVFTWFDHAPAVRALETKYFSVLCYGALPMLLASNLSCFFSGRGQTLVVMGVNVSALAIHAGLDWLLIFGNLGFPELGMRGAALSMVLAYSAEVVIYASVMALHPARRQFALASAWRFDRKLLRRILRYGFPNGIHIFADVICFTLFILMIGQLGTTALTASNLAFVLNSMIFAPLYGLSIAVSTLTGQRIGEGRPALAVRTVWKAFSLAMTYVGACAAVFVLAPQWLLAVYGAGVKDPAEFEPIANLVTVLLRFIAVYSLFDAMTIVFSSATRGAGDTRFALAYMVTCGITLMLTPTYVGILLTRNGYTAHGLEIGWTSATIYIIVLGIGFLLRFLYGPWQKMRVIEATAVE